MPSCVISQVADDRILIACHIKPFAKCDEIEEFDMGFISFDENANLIVSDFLSKLNQKKDCASTQNKTKTSPFLNQNY